MRYFLDAWVCGSSADGEALLAPARNVMLPKNHSSLQLSAAAGGGGAGEEEFAVPPGMSAETLLRLLTTLCRLNGLAWSGSARDLRTRLKVPPGGLNGGQRVWDSVCGTVVWGCCVGLLRRLQTECTDHAACFANRTKHARTNDTNRRPLGRRGSAGTPTRW
jgi:hypothetical protein